MYVLYKEPPIQVTAKIPNNYSLQKKQKQTRIKQDKQLNNIQYLCKISQKKEEGMWTASSAPVTP